MASALPGHPFSAVLQALKDQGRCCTNLSCSWTRHQKSFLQPQRSLQLNSHLHAAVTAVKQTATQRAALSDFYAVESSFEHLGYDQDVCSAIRAAGFDRPSRVQVRLESTTSAAAQCR